MKRSVNKSRWHTCRPLCFNHLWLFQKTQHDSDYTIIIIHTRVKLFSRLWSGPHSLLMHWLPLSARWYLLEEEMMSTGRKSAGGNEEEEMALPIKSCRVVNRISYQASGARNSWEQYGICVCVYVCVWGREVGLHLPQWCHWQRSRQPGAGVHTMHRWDNDAAWLEAADTCVCVCVSDASSENTAEQDEEKTLLRRWDAQTDDCEHKGKEAQHKEKLCVHQLSSRFRLLGKRAGPRDRLSPSWRKPLA